MYKFDGILDGKNVQMFPLIDLIDHRRQRGGFARAGRAGDQHQAARQMCELQNHILKGDILGAEYPVRNQTKHGPQSPILPVHVDTKTHHAAAQINAIGEVNLPVLVQAQALIIP